MICFLILCVVHLAMVLLAVFHVTDQNSLKLTDAKMMNYIQQVPTSLRPPLSLHSLLAVL